MTTSPTTADSPALTRPRVLWLDLMKAIALLWIFLNHVVEQIFGYPFIGNPAAGWPPLSERIAQLQPLAGFGLWGIPINLVRYLGWIGDQGVTLFLIVSGFGLTWGLLARHGNAGIKPGFFYLQRAKRVYPLWWAVHLLFMGVWLITGWGLSMTNPATYLSIIGIRVTPELLYYFSPAWWYVGLLIQLYLIYPFLWATLRQAGPMRLLVVSCAIAFAVRAAGLLLFEDYLDAWSRGAIFITRLPEFVFGISLAAWLHTAPGQIDDRLRSRRALLLSAAAAISGLALSLTLPGMTFAPFLLGVGVFVLLYALLAGPLKTGSSALRPATWTGRHSYSLYLLHHTWILILVPVGLSAGAWRIFGGIGGALMLTVVGAIALEAVTGGATAVLGRWHTQGGLRRIAGRLAAIGIAAAVILLGSELLIYRTAPQEVLGWGERASLAAHPVFGWQLKPSSETWLRWESYDYRVSANGLGFPGPQYAEQKDAQTLRVLTVGDAFTSAEGVDTAQAWPRLLEADLAAQLPGHTVEVLNFGITGYGPNQYAAVLETYVPRYRPDVIIIGFYVNEYIDVLWSNEEFQQSIGFDRPAQNSWQALVSLSHMRKYMQLQLAEPLKERLRGTPRPHGYFLGGFLALERDQPELNGIGQQRVAEQLQHIKTIADAAGTPVIIAMIPAPVQVCRPSDLLYFPGGLDVQDTTRFDVEQPQRLTRTLADSLGFTFFDLRLPLNAVAECPYQPQNIHWTARGHQVVAAFLADKLMENGYTQYSWRH